LTPVTLQPAARRLLAAIWFTAFGLLATVIFFHQLSMTAHAVVLYIVLPSVSAGVAGYIWGGAILDSSKVKSYGEAVLRGLGVSAGAYVIFALLYACGLPLLEAGWSLRQAGGLLLFSFTFGLLLGGPMASIAGMIAATSLFGFGHHLVGRRDDRTEKSIG
jgi:hypothetical protein